MQVVPPSLMIPPSEVADASASVQAASRSWSNLETIWADPNVVRVVALVAVTLLVLTVVLFRRSKASGRGAAIVCLILSVGLHVALIVFVPKLSALWRGGGPESDAESNVGSADIAVSTFDPEMIEKLTESGDSDPQPAPLAALPLPEPLLPERVAKPANEAANESDTPESPAIEMPTPKMPTSLASAAMPKPPTGSGEVTDALNDSIDDWLRAALAEPEAKPQPAESPVPTERVASLPATPSTNMAPIHPSASLPRQPTAGTVDEDFASRLGAAKTAALIQNGGDSSTETAVAAALKYLASKQRDDGAWDPRSTGAGQERSPLGLQRGGAGRNAETAITGLALLSLLGSGHTHQDGDYQETVYRGLAFLLSRQRSDGSLASGASVYAAHYSHAMASLALAETAAMTGDASAMEATRRAVDYTRSMQHPVTGGWRYNRGDKGDLSQLGWQALLIDAAHRADATRHHDSMTDGVRRFLKTVQSGRAGGFAAYRPGERPSPTMTAEALATRLLIGEDVPDATIREAESMILANLPGQAGGPDNYYYWYYATMALHQLQDDAWETWNAALKQRLTSTQLPDGSWSDKTMWGGYGGTIYTTSMATLCLESYYRHSRR